MTIIKKSILLLFVLISSGFGAVTGGSASSASSDPLARLASERAAYVAWCQNPENAARFNALGFFLRQWTEADRALPTFEEMRAADSPEAYPSGFFLGKLHETFALVREKVSAERAEAAEVSIGEVEAALDGKSAISLVEFEQHLLKVLHAVDPIGALEAAQLSMFPGCEDLSRVFSEASGIELVASANPKEVMDPHLSAIRVALEDRVGKRMNPLSIPLSAGVLGPQTLVRSYLLGYGGTPIATDKCHVHGGIYTPVGNIFHDRFHSMYTVFTNPLGFLEAHVLELARGLAEEAGTPDDLESYIPEAVERGIQQYTEFAIFWLNYVRKVEESIDADEPAIVLEAKRRLAGVFQMTHEVEASLKECLGEEGALVPSYLQGLIASAKFPLQDFEEGLRHVLEERREADPSFGGAGESAEGTTEGLDFLVTAALERYNHRPEKDQAVSLTVTKVYYSEFDWKVHVRVIKADGEEVTDQIRVDSEIYRVREHTNLKKELRLFGPKYAGFERPNHELQNAIDAETAAVAQEILEEYFPDEAAAAAGEAE